MRDWLGVLVLALSALRPVAWASDPGAGTLAGVLYDSRSGKPVPGALVEVIEDPRLKTTSNQDGVFRFELAPGSYSLRITAQGFHPAQLDQLVVRPGQVTDASKVLSFAGDVTQVEVVERLSAGAATAESVIAERRLLASISDGASAEEISNSVASDAAAALTRVTGVSLVGSGYVYVRGLGERYSATLLNNALVPTTEPERRVVPLDLFPVELIDRILVLKTYSPDLPGEFSGGLVRMHTVEFPARRILRLSTSYGFNARTTGRPFLTYPGGRYDFFGFDDGSRRMPASIPANSRLFPGRFSEAQFEQFGEAFARNWEPVPIASARPQQSFTLVGGDSIGRLGLVGALTFSNKLQRSLELQRYLVNAGKGEVRIHTEYPDFTADTESARLGGVLNAALRLSPTHKLVFRSMLTRDTDKETRVFAGYNGGVDTWIHSTRLRWVERSLQANSFDGEHTLARLRNSILRWQFTWSGSRRDEPDMREVFRTPRADGVLVFSAMPQSGLRFFNHLDDRIREPQLDWSLPFYRGGVSGMLLFGYRASFRERHFEARRFRFTPVRTATLDLTLPSNRLFSPENIRPDGFVVREVTRGTDTYDGQMRIHGAYAMTDLSWASRWRLVAGLRLEDSAVDVTTIDPLVPGAVPAVARLRNRDPLPAANLIYSLGPRQNLRLAFARTVARPDFRELSPFDFTNVLGGFNVVGNPRLVRTAIENYDARWELFFGGDQLLAASLFYKTFHNPIEVTIQATTSDLRQTFLNAHSARNRGIEIEMRRRLAALHPRLNEFLLAGNFTFVDSHVRIPDSQRTVLTSLRRPLVGQSRYLANLLVEWMKPSWRSQARFYMNYTSRRLSDVGAMGLPDIYQEGFAQLDFVYHFHFREDGRWSLRLAAENLGDTHYRWTQAGILQRSFRLGRTISVGTSYSIF
ncbi:MAG: TonB-dependent receptor [Bryobacterales bacterium]|nr:TonB-dependent receptor [Bryobacterales bacterium]